MFVHRTKKLLVRSTSVGSDILYFHKPDQAALTALHFPNLWDLKISLALLTSMLSDHDAFVQSCLDFVSFYIEDIT